MSRIGNGNHTGFLSVLCQKQQPLTANCHLGIRQGDMPKSIPIPQTNNLPKTTLSDERSLPNTPPSIPHN